VSLLAEFENEVDFWLDKQLILRWALNISLERENEEEKEKLDDGGVN
jgi:hypothetical protein